MSGRLRLPARTSVSRSSVSGTSVSRTARRGVAAAGIVVSVVAGSAACTSGAPSSSQLYALRMCESGGNYHINTGNGFYGAYQFTLGTWRGLGYGGYPHQASPATQDAAVRKLYARSGWSPWPVCGQRARRA